MSTTTIRLPDDLKTRCLLGGMYVTAQMSERLSMSEIVILEEHRAQDGYFFPYVESWPVCSAKSLNQSSSRYPTPRKPFPILKLYNLFPSGPVREWITSHFNPASR